MQDTADDNKKKNSENQAEENVDQTIYSVKIIHSGATEHCVCDQGSQVNCGDTVVVPTRYGKELGRVQGFVKYSDLDGSEVQAITRKASTQDLERYRENETREKRAFAICQEKIIEHGMGMKLVSAHYLVDEAKVLFYFTADSRVDFRELVKDLVAIFKMRIELRQIGVRDATRVLGGMGVCGRGYCCHCITDKLKPVSIKMAKEQNLSLNSMKISGPCGRLLCCLSYEYDTYREAKKDLPVEGMCIGFDNEQFRVMEIDILLRKIKLTAEGGRCLNLDFKRFIYNKEKEEWEIRPE